MTLMDWKTAEQWADILTRFACETQMAAALIDDEGIILQCQGERFPLCQAVRDHQQSLTFICGQTNTAMFAEVKKARRPITDLCEGGLLRMVVPLVWEDEVVGQVNACGLAPADEELDPFILAKQMDISEGEVLALARSTPTGDEEELQAIADQLFADLSS